VFGGVGQRRLAHRPLRGLHRHLRFSTAGAEVERPLDRLGDLARAGFTQQLGSGHVLKRWRATGEAVV
jgi:hypothetical protein